MMIFLLAITFMVSRSSTDSVKSAKSGIVKRSMRLPSNIDFNQVKEIIPVEEQQFYERLTKDDKVVLQNVLSKSATYNDVSEVLNDLRNGSMALYDRSVSVMTQMRKTIASLSPTARKFVDESVEQIRGILNETFSIGKIRAEANLIVERYRALDDLTKEELKTAFPTISSVIYNNVFQTLAAGLLGINT